MLYKKFKTILPKFFKFHAKNLLRLLDVTLMIFCLHFYPNLTHKFSTRKFLPSNEYKNDKNKLIKVPYKLIDKMSSNLKKFNEVNAIGIGASFDLNQLKNFSKPTFLLSFWDSLKIDQQGKIAYFSEKAGYGHKLNIDQEKDYKDYINPNLIYVVSKFDLIKNLISKGHKVLVVNTYTRNKDAGLYTPGSYDYASEEFMKIIKSPNVLRVSQIDEIFKYPVKKPFSDWSQTGSIIPYLSAISFLSDRINVYGWDFFLNKSPNKMSYIELLSKMYINKIDWKRSLSHFEEALFNYYFGYSFSKNEKFKIYSYMGQLLKHEKLIRKIEKVLFN